MCESGLRDKSAREGSGADAGRELGCAAFGMPRRNAPEAGRRTRLRNLSFGNRRHARVHASAQRALSPAPPSIPSHVASRRLPPSIRAQPQASTDLGEVGAPQRPAGVRGATGGGNCAVERGVMVLGSAASPSHKALSRFAADAEPATASLEPIPIALRSPAAAEHCRLRRRYLRVLSRQLARVRCRAN